jgi:hypothetical protein
LVSRFALYEAPCWPLAREVVVMLRGGITATVMLSDLVAVCAVGVVAAETLTVKLEEPEAVGVPVICPVDEFSKSPLGSAPELIDHE